MRYTYNVEFIRFTRESKVLDLVGLGGFELGFGLA
jgi:hypothetical protein